MIAPTNKKYVTINLISYNARSVWRRMNGCDRNVINHSKQLLWSILIIVCAFKVWLNLKWKIWAAVYSEVKAKHKRQTGWRDCYDKWLPQETVARFYDKELRRMANCGGVENIKGKQLNNTASDDLKQANDFLLTLCYSKVVVCFKILEYLVFFIVSLSV